MFSETKIDNSFTISHFTITGYSISFRLTRTNCESSMLFFDIVHVKQLKPTAKLISRGFFVEIHLKKNVHFAVFAIHIKVILQTILKAFVRHWTNLM